MTTAPTSSVCSSHPGYDRRTVIRCAGALGAGACGALLAACGGSDGAATSDPATAGAGGAAATVKASAVPVGGGVILKAAKVVVTQPKAGQFKAFSANCTHQGFLVGEVRSGSIVCLQHGSRFDIATGDVQSGPASSPLAPRTLSVAAGTVTVG